MPGKPPETGPTSDSVAENLKRLRNEQRLNYTEVSELLFSRAHWDIAPTAIRRIEEGVRRVSVDDLVALAVALGVSPATLLMPHHVSPGARAKATGTGTQNAVNIWNWLTARNALKGEAAQKELLEFWMRSWPAWEQEHIGEEIQRRKQRIVKRKGDK
jgi:transcriptional regulator with XRE-family HTH domain